MNFSPYCSMCRAEPLALHQGADARTHIYGDSTAGSLWVWQLEAQNRKRATQG